MNKYKLGQTVYWFKYVGTEPILMSLQIGCIKENSFGYKYGSGGVGGKWAHESICFETIEGAVNYGIQVLKRFLQ